MKSDYGKIMPSILVFNANNLRRTSMENGFMMSKKPGILGFANYCGTVDANPDKILYNSYICAEGKLDENAQERLSEYANSSQHLHMAIASGAFPKLKDLRRKSEYHKLDSGFHIDDENKKSYIVTWLSLSPEEQFPDSMPSTRKYAYSLMDSLWNFTKWNNIIYLDDIETGLMEGRRDLENINARDFVPELPRDIVIKFLSRK